MRTLTSPLAKVCTAHEPLAISAPHGRPAGRPLAGHADRPGGMKAGVPHRHTAGSAVSAVSAAGANPQQAGSGPAIGPARHLDVLDGLRGVAVLVVLASHFSNAGLFPRPALQGVGKSGVYLFFVLSAYLLTRNLLSRPPGTLARARVWLDYALRRVLRIWPLYLVVLGLSWLAFTHGHAWLYAIDTPALWRHLGLREGQSVLWSIPVEFSFYLCLPLVVLGLRGMDRARWPAWLQCAAFVLALGLCTWRWPPAASVENDVRLGSYLVVFLCGAFAARVDAWLAGVRGSTAWTAAGLTAILLWCVAVPALWCRLRGLAFEPTVTRAWFLFFGLSWSVLLLALLHGSERLRRVFAWRPLRWVGLVSFSLYLWHLPVMDALLRAGLAERLPLLLPWIALALALAVAGVSYRLFERPQRNVRLAASPAPARGAGKPAGGAD